MDETLKILQDINYQTLAKFHEVCNKHGLTYFLVYGTLLGAVRHGGFIPWDDDIDVAMPRKDYDLLIEKYSDEFKNDYEFCYGSKHDMKNNSIVRIFNAKATVVRGNEEKGISVKGACLDVHPIDGAGNDYKKGKKRFDYIERLHKLYYCFGIKNKIKKNILKRIIIAIAKVIGPKKLFKKIEKKLRKIPYENSKYVAVYYAVYGNINVIPREYFGKPKIISFNNKEFYAPEKTEDYLAHIYGDYMTLPPVEKQVSHHNILHIDLDTPYKEFDIDHYTETHK